jgi:phage-related minor tail protein
MSDEPDDDDGAADIEMFKKLLKEHGGEWLTEQMEALKKSGSPTPKTAPAQNQSDFFAEAYRETKAELKNKTEALDRALDMLTNEQRTLWRSLLSGAPAPSPKTKKEPDPPAAPKKKPSWML